MPGRLDEHWSESSGSIKRHERGPWVRRLLHDPGTTTVLLLLLLSAAVVDLFI